MSMNQGKTIVTRAVAVETDFEDFESISIVDAGESDGFQVRGGDVGVDKASEWVQIPTGIPYNAGTASGMHINKISIKAKSGGTLNASVSIVY